MQSRLQALFMLFWTSLVRCRALRPTDYTDRASACPACSQQMSRGGLTPVQIERGSPAMVCSVQTGLVWVM